MFKKDFVHDYIFSLFFNDGPLLRCALFLSSFGCDSREVMVESLCGEILSPLFFTACICSSSSFSSDKSGHLQEWQTEK